MPFSELSIGDGFCFRCDTFTLDAIKVGFDIIFNLKTLTVQELPDLSIRVIKLGRVAIKGGKGVGTLKY